MYKLLYYTYSAESSTVAKVADLDKAPDLSSGFHTLKVWVRFPPLAFFFSLPSSSSSSKKSKQHGYMRVIFYLSIYYYDIFRHPKKNTTYTVAQLSLSTAIRSVSASFFVSSSSASLSLSNTRLLYFFFGCFFHTFKFSCEYIVICSPSA